MSLLAAALIIIPTLTGASSAIAVRLTSEKISTLAIGAIGGLGLTPLLIYGLSLFIPVSSITAWTVLLISLLISTALLWQHRQWWKKTKTDKFLLAASSLFLIFSLLLGSKLIFFEKDALATSIPNAWGDLGWHMANITSFAYGQSVPPENPIFAGTRLTYPFLTNYYSGLLLRFGAGYAGSISLPTATFLWLLLILLWIFTKKLTQSNLAAAIVLVMFIGSGAPLGGWRIFEDISASQHTLLNFLTHLPREYSGSGSDPDGYHFLNIFMAGLLPQRALLMGMPLALALVILLLEGTQNRRISSFISAGVLAGVIPLAHAHTVIALIPVVILLFIRHLWPLRKSKKERLAVLPLWLIFALASAIVGLPSVLYFILGESVGSGHFLTFDPGWTLAPQQNFFWFWFMNTGLVLPAALLILFFKNLPAQLRIIGIAAAAVWIIANFFRFAPWAWDNYKLLVYWYVFSLPLLAWLAANTLRFKWRLLLFPAAALFIFFHSYTGWLDVSRALLPTAAAWTDWSKEDIEFAQVIKEKTPPGKTILTAPYHNHPVALAGRPVYLGYSAHVWSHGGNPAPREQSIPPYYNGTLSRLPETPVHYVVIGPVERSRFSPVVTRSNWQIIAQTPSYQLYRVNK